eukprot:COSAG02_NODE_53214_length_303_cov_0.759804_1_plen_54_part_10
MVDCFTTYAHVAVIIGSIKMGAACLPICIGYEYGQHLKSCSGCFQIVILQTILP